MRMTSKNDLQTTLLLFILILMIYENGINGQTSTALHLVPSTDPSIKMFPEPGSKYDGLMQHLRINLINPNKTKLIVGAKEYIFQLDLESFDLKNSSESRNIIKIVADQKAIVKCKRFRKLPECMNYMMFAAYNGTEDLFACGTFATSTRCWHINANNFTLGRVHVAEEGELECDLAPQSYKANAIGVAAANGFIVNVITDYNVYDFKTSSIFGLRTNNYAISANNREHAFTDPTFVASYAADDGFIYFFFTETAREVTERKTVYSRVARVCQYDTGPKYVNTDRFATFRKSQIVCYKKGKVPDYYDHIQSATAVTVHDSKGNSEVYIYAAFTTTIRSTGSSAICRYKLKDIQHVFQTSQYLKRIYIRGGGLKYEIVNHPRPHLDVSRYKCNSSLDTHIIGSSPFGQWFPLLYSDNEPFDKTSVMLFRGERITAIAVEDFHQTKNKTDDAKQVIFAATESGEIYKVVMNNSNVGEPFFIEKIQLVKGSKTVINKLQFYKDYLIATGPNIKLYKIKKERCEASFLLCSDCIKSRDPFCAWSISKKKCTPARELPLSDRLQDIATGNDSMCPPVDIHISCSLRIVDNIPGARTALQCTGFGLLPPKVLAWKRGATILNIKNIYEVRVVNATSQILIIKDYTTKDLGTYGCVVGAGRNKSVCTVTVPGTKPEVNCSTTYANCSCDVTGYPFPSIRKVVNGNETFKVNQPGPFFIESGVFVFAMNAFGDDSFSCRVLSRPATTSTTTAMKTTTTTTVSTTQTVTTTEPTTLVDSTKGTTAKPSTKKTTKFVKSSTSPAATTQKPKDKTTAEATRKTPATPGQRVECPAPNSDKYFGAFVACLVLLVLIIFVVIIGLYFMLSARNDTYYDEEDEFDGKKKGNMDVSASHDSRPKSAVDLFRRRRHKVRKTDSNRPLVKEPKNGCSQNSPTKKHKRESYKTAQEMDDLVLSDDGKTVHT